MSSEGIDSLDRLQDILSFAIRKEQEAVDFYTDLAARVRTDSISQELRRIAAMEVQHRERLIEMDLDAATTNVALPAADLRIAEYLVERQPTPGMTWQELVTIAMQRELASVKLYTGLARLTNDPPVRRLFENLAAEESNHKLFFERVWDEEILTEN